MITQFYRHLSFNLLILILLLINTSCSMKKKLDEMHDYTREMNSNTKVLKNETSKMSKTTKDMSKTTNGMATTTTEMAQTTQDMKNNTKNLPNLTNQMFDVMKQKDSAVIRAEAFRNLIASESLMNKAFEASKYYYAFEFQLWNYQENSSFDQIKLRESQQSEAVIELTKNLAELMPEQKRKWNLSSTSTNNEMLSLYALAIAMHKNNPFQTQLMNDVSGTQVQSTNPQIKVESFYEVITQALAILPQVRQGIIPREDLTMVQKEALREADQLIYLLKLRYKVLPVIALVRMSNIQENIWQKIKMLFSAWQIKSLNTEQINYLSDIIDQSLETKTFLNSIGVSVELDNNVRKVYRHLNWHKTISAQASQDKNSEDSQNIKALMNLQQKVSVLLK